MFGLSQLKLAIALAGFLGTAVVTGIIVHKFDNARYDRLVASYAQAETKAVQAARAEEQRIAAIHSKAAAVYAVNIDKLNTNTITLIQEVPRYVIQTAFVGCIPLGFIRVLDAEIYGASPESLPLPAGTTDGTCSPLAPDLVAQRIIAAFNVAKQNAEQLNSLGAVSRPDPH